MNPSSIMQKVSQYMFDHYSKDSGALLVHLGALGWILGSAAQIGVVVSDKSIDKEQKRFLLPQEAADAAVKAVKELSVRVGIPQHLSELGIKAEDLPRLAKAAYADVCTPGNPREVTEEIILDLYKKVL